MKPTTLKKLAVIALMGMTVQTANGADLGTTPYLHPNPCELKADPRGFEVYTSKNCDTLFLAPRTVEKSENTIKLEGSAALCDGHNSMLVALNKRAETFNKLTEKAFKAMEAGNEAAYEKWSAQADQAEVRLINTQKQYAQFSALHASTVRSLFENKVSGQDIYDFIVQNALIFWNADEKPEVVKVPTMNSIYSFTHYKPENAGSEARSILSTTIPGLEPLVQPSAQQINVAHVKADDVISGESRLTLMGTCPMLEKVDGQWVEKEDGISEVFTVNRTYEVPMKAAYTLKATLNTKVATDVLAKMLVQTANHGLSKTQYYEKLLNIEGEEAFTMVYDEDHGFSEDEKKLISYDIQKRLVDRYLQIYESRSELTNLTPVKLDPPTGGTVDVVHTARRCWSSSSFFGLSKKGGCYDYQYTVPTWMEGKNYNEIYDLLHVDLNLSETIEENKIYYYPKSTTFYNKGE